jgi:hypothetical protein
MALILGSGFSRESGLPTTAALNKELLGVPTGRHVDAVLESEISRILGEFWRDVFGWKAKGRKPTLEDHFTVIDLAANTGHHLGPDYGPRKLRAIRRMSIHRIFQILDARFTRSDAVDRLYQELLDTHELSIITLNWDIVAEKYAVSAGTRKFCYGCGERDLSGLLVGERGIPILKLHGSSNSIYCNCCRTVFCVAADETELYKAALDLKLYLEPEDFEIFGAPREVSESLQQFMERNRTCVICNGKVAVRIATFSYRKDLSVPYFQASWDRAGLALREAEHWLFIGYSMPEADFEFRHLLKSSQLAHCPIPGRRIDAVVANDRAAARRYRSFFGMELRDVLQGGLSEWVTREYGAA